MMNYLLATIFLCGLCVISGYIGYRFGYKAGYAYHFIHQHAEDEYCLLVKKLPNKDDPEARAEAWRVAVRDANSWDKYWRRLSLREKWYFHTPATWKDSTKPPVLCP